ncbi:aminodeoxychorismate synthase component I [Actinopolymorpha singaporensis]|uniref:aminodeoxychorismate synthase n=1 Tax=Actinopolymorpha singaporensis TaxID=117157 RepID=A0A1H1Y285_9ACTN|nr:aminodeoxychorismate synthase component I [Actinopolymorpha singaporensis]SDT15533.1 aminodeoxychorismate synthase, component I [Actinopolymorpha singaporensis]
MTKWVLRCRELAATVDAEQAFRALFGAGRRAYWLDSSMVGGPARYSVLGECAGPHADVLIDQVGPRPTPPDPDPGDAADPGDSGDPVDSVYDRLERRLAERRVDVPAELPAELACGYVGYFGYELRAHDGAPSPHRSELPDAYWMAATRYLALDHLAGRAWLVELGTADTPASWLDDAATTLAGLPATSRTDRPNPGLPNPSTPEPDPEPWLARPRETYLRDVRHCLDRLRAGDSYEVCLTNTVEMPFAGTPFEAFEAFEAYCRLRRRNPAPYAAYLRLDDLHVLSASPERFLRVDAQGYAESRPIKGTAPRGDEPVADDLARKELSASTKAQAENLMIVDLVRNDLGRVCEPGSISVPAFCSVESYATVHQLVSTVRGRLRSDVTAVRAARACFPPGSMTGAPKLSTMRILDRLETRPRGIYSGALGHFGLAGTADLSVVIRTAVIHRGRLTVGAGGAIVLDSDPADEWDEMLMKAAVPLRALVVPPCDE